MNLDGDAMQLYDYPAWRTVGETLRDLAALLLRVGRGDDSPARDLAAQIETLLNDRESAAELLPADYRMAVPLGKGRPALTDEFDMETALAAWLTDLARQFRDVPRLLAVPDAATALGPALTSDLPRAWQSRLSAVVQGLRQQVRGSLGGGILAATGTGLSVAGNGLRYVTPDGPDRYAVVLPADLPEAGEVARRELRLLLLRDLGPDVARLHLCLQGAPAGADATLLCRALGVRATQRAGVEQVYGALARLRRVQLSVLTWQAAPGTVTWERQAAPLWDVAVREFGQACLDERSGALGAHGTEWSFQPRPGSWGQDGTLAAEAHLLLETLQGRRNSLSLATALLLGAGGGPTVTLQNAEVLALAGALGELPSRDRLRAAARLQRLWGWEPDYSQDGAITYTRKADPPSS